MDKTTLNAHLVTTELKRVFYNLRSVDCERSDLWKAVLFLRFLKACRGGARPVATGGHSGAVALQIFCAPQMTQTRKINANACFQSV